MLFSSDLPGSLSQAFVLSLPPDLPGQPREGAGDGALTWAGPQKQGKSPKL